MDRWDWIWLDVITQLAIFDRLTPAECDAEWDKYAGRLDYDCPL